MDAKHAILFADVYPTVAFHLNISAIYTINTDIKYFYLHNYIHIYTGIS